MTAAEAASIPPHAARRPDVSLVRLYALRALYLVIGLFLLSGVGPNLLQPAPTLMTGVARALFVALGLLALLGLRYPLRMLPLLLFELAWKAAWMLAYGLPAWSAGTLDPGSAETFRDCAIGVPLVLLVLPWRYLRDQYVTRPGDRWR